MLYIMCISVRLYVYFIKQVTVGWCTMVVFLFLCCMCCCNPFIIHSRNVRNVFVICVLHIRHAKVWFLRCKKVVFSVQKGGFCIAKVWFLFFECCVVAICLECYHNPFVAKWQSVSNILAIRSQCFGNPFAIFWQSVSNVLAIRSQHFGNPFAMFW